MMGYDTDYVNECYAMILLLFLLHSLREDSIYSYTMISLTCCTYL